jgi:transposase
MRRTRIRRTIRPALGMKEVRKVRGPLLINWHLLSNPEARFAGLGPDWHERKTDRDHKIRAHRRQLRALGLNVTITRAAAICNKLRLWPRAELVMIVTA